MTRIYLSNLGKWNEGVLIGEWVSLPCTEEEIKDVLFNIGINDTYEEWFISDYETDIPNFEIDEYEDIFELNALLERFEDLSEYDKEVVGAILESERYSNLEDAIDNIDDVVYYSGNPDDILYDIINEELFSITYGKEIPEILTRYFNYDAYKRDLMYDYTEVSTGLILNY